jgi:hypothetical protein
MNLLDLPLELIEHIVQFIADGLALLPYRLVSQLFNNLILRHAFADFCPRTQNKFRALLATLPTAASPGWSSAHQTTRLSCRGGGDGHQV